VRDDPPIFQPSEKAAVIKVHKYSNATAFTNVVHPIAEFTMSLSLAQFQEIHGGGFIDEPPPGYRDPLPGFELYRTAAGQVLGVSE
jgi:hypothetical protein